MRVAVLLVLICALAVIVVYFVMRPSFNSSLRWLTMRNPPSLFGKWVEIARSPNSFQSSCSGRATATYSERTDGNIRVINACGGTAAVEGVARRRALPGWLQVSFLPGVLRDLLPWGDYLILAFDEGSSSMFVGSDTIFWILQRESAFLNKIPVDVTRFLRFASQLGFSTSDVIQWPDEQA